VISLRRTFLTSMTPCFGFLTSVARVSRVPAVTLAVRLAQARHSALAVFAARQTAGVGGVLVLLVAQDASEVGLAAAGVGVGVDWEAGAVDTPEGGERARRGGGEDGVQVCRSNFGF